MARAHCGKKQQCGRGWLVLWGVLVCLLPAFAAAQDTPADFSSLAAKATAARTENDLPHALQFYGEALRLNPDWKEGWWYFGLLQYQSNSYPGARDALTRYLALEPNAGPAFALRGLCEFETGEYGPSLQDIERGIALGAASQPHNEQILRYHEAVLLTRMGRFQDALRAYTWFARKGITSPELIEDIGLAGLRTAVLPKDAGDKQRGLYIAAGNAAFEYMAGNEEKAKSLFDELFQQYPAAANAHLLYGFLLFERHPKQAAQEFKRELDVAPTNAGANVMLAWACLMQNDFSGALPYAEKAAQEEPDVPISQLVLGRSLVGTGDVKEGTQYLEKARQLDPSNPEIHIALAKAYSEAGRKEDAWRERMESLQLTSAQTTPTANP